MTQITSDNATVNTATTLPDNNVDNQHVHHQGSDSALDVPSQGLDQLLNTPTKAELIAADSTTAEALMYPDKPATIDTELAQAPDAGWGEFGKPLPPGYQTQPGVNDAATAQDFRNGVAGAGVVNSDVLGPIDAKHIGGSFNKFAQVLEAVETSARTGQPVSDTLHNGSSAITYMSQDYTVNISPDATQAEKIAIAREITLSFMYAYEENSVKLGGAANVAGQALGLGTSAFSTEDLTSNALGVMAAEHYVRSNSADALFDLGANGPIYARNFVADRAGNIQPTEDDTVSVFGNRDYLPEYQHGHYQTRGAREGTDVYQYLQARQNQFQAIGDFSPSSGNGWQFSTDEPVIPHEAEMRREFGR